MRLHQKLYYVDISGKLYTYMVAEITDERIVIVPEDNPNFKIPLTIGQAVMLFMKGFTAEMAIEEAEKRRELMGMQA